MLRAWLLLHLEWGLSYALRLPVEEQSHLVLRLRFLLVWLIFLLLPLQCPPRPAVSSVRRSPALAGVPSLVQRWVRLSEEEASSGSFTFPWSFFSPTAEVLSVFFGVF